MTQISEIEFTKLNLDDIDGVYALWSDESATLFTNFPYLQTMGECQQRLEKMLAHYGQNTDHFGPYVVRGIDGTFLGLTGGDADSSAQGTYEIWYFIRRDYWGKKIATRAVEHLLDLMSKASTPDLMIIDIWSAS